MIETVQKIFRTGFLLKQLNHSFIVLIPKVDHLAKIDQFRPISLCNVVYKVVSKILAVRLKCVLPKLISPYQAAFVPGWTIQENSILGQKVIHSMKAKRGRKGLVTVKIDMEKAFDWMKWGFLLQILSCFGFDSKWISWIEQCISTVSYSVLLNGLPVGFFHPSRGLRQGDPLSPFLFILGMEVLSHMLVHAENSGLFHGIKVSRSAPSISHLLFADDLLIFCRVIAREAHQINTILDNYSRVSGQKVNKAKSALFCNNNTHPDVVISICDILHVRKMGLDSKY